MTQLPGFSPHDRVLVAAPHPDDEAIATGGALQAARAAGAQCRVLVVTDGDNNPWPQRWIEKRWRIGAADRARWGAQRRAEALAAVQALGLDAAAARCLGFPDLGLTGLLMAGAPAFESALAEQLGEFRPTHLFLPALDDRHPDHSALHVALRLALMRLALTPNLFTFGVHGEAAVADDVVMPLSATQRETKRNAIGMHATQMRLSRRRFMAYAREYECFRRAATPSPSQAAHPLQARIDANGELEVRIDHARWRGSLRNHVLRAILHRRDGVVARRCVAVDGADAGAITDTTLGQRIGRAVVERTKACTKLTFAAGAGIDTGWVKLATPAAGLFVLDRFGWQAVDVAVS